MKKMLNPDLEVIRFASEDILTASGSGIVEINDGGIPVIWLDALSVENFNNMTTSDYLQDKYNGRFSRDYYAYNGDWYDDLYFVTTGAKNASELPENAIINNLTMGDTSKYNEILNWLTKHKNVLD